MPKTANINIRIDPIVKKNSEELFQSLGITVSDAINMFLNKSLIEGGLPFEVKNKSLAKKATYSIDEIRDILAPIFGRHNTKKAILFGSYAKGVENENSDIDIFVDSGLKGLSFFGLLEDVSQSLDKKIDLIDKSDVVKGSDMEKEILKTGVVIYER